MDTPTELPSYAHTLRHIIAAMTQVLTTKDNPAEYPAADGLLAELMQEDPEDLVVAYTGALTTFVEALAKAMDIQPADAWRDYATAVAVSLADEEAT